MSRYINRLFVLYESIRLGAIYLVWRVTGVPCAGQALLHGLENNEPIRMLAGILLSKDKIRTIPLLAEAIRRRYQLPIVLTILADIGNSSVRPTLQEFMNDHDSEVAHAAQEAMRILEVRHPSHSSSGFSRNDQV